MGNKARVTAVLVGVLVLAVAAEMSFAYVSASQLRGQATRLRTLWDRDQKQGVTVAQLTPLRTQLGSLNLHDWYWPGFLTQSASSTVSHLQTRTEQIWQSSLQRSRHKASAYLTDYRRYLKTNQAWLPKSDHAPSPTYASRLSRGRTPGAFLSLSSQLALKLQQAQAAVKAAQAKAVQLVAAAESQGGLLAEASKLESIAQSDNLSPLTVPQTAAGYRSALSSNHNPAASQAALAQAISQLQAEVGLNDQVSTADRSLLLQVDQAGAEQIPNSQTYLSQYHADHSALLAARTAAQLAAVQTSDASLAQTVQQALSANQCGHSSISGKSIYISLSLQEMVFYDNGCEVNATPVTTGRPQLPTPTGTFSIFDKQSPYVFISPWPPGSPFWYPTSPVNWVMEFDQGGYYIHDAPWEPTSAYGPGSEYDLADVASHGCVQTPTAAMQWAYSWTPMGTPVVISN